MLVSSSRCPDLSATWACGGLKCPGDSGVQPSENFLSVSLSKLHSAQWHSQSFEEVIKFYIVCFVWMTPDTLWNLSLHPFLPFSVRNHETFKRWPRYLLDLISCLALRSVNMLGPRPALSLRVCCGPARKTLPRSSPTSPSSPCRFDAYVSFSPKPFLASQFQASAPPRFWHLHSASSFLALFFLYNLLL